MDRSTLGGIVIAIGGISAGLWLEGAKFVQILQPTAAMIVFGGTIGAVLIQFPSPAVVQAVRRVRDVFFDRTRDRCEVVQVLVRFAHQARRKGIVSLDDDLAAIDDDFLRRALMLAVDGAEPQELRTTMELVIDNLAEQEEQAARVFESAGGFAPTIGIIGAVLGLIQVMQHLQNVDQIGKGIAVAFVATIYGVGAANLLFLPAAGKLKNRIRQEQVIQEMMLEGVISILEGMNPRMLETKLRAYCEPGKEASHEATAS